MYKVENGSAWNIAIDNVVVMEVTSEHYANYLCNQLNNEDVTIEDIKNRQHPDIDYFEYCKDLSGIEQTDNVR